jgi:hypothetical protein
MSWFATPLQRVLEAWARADGDLGAALDALGTPVLRTKADARACCLALRALDARRLTGHTEFLTPLHALTALIGRITGESALAEVETRGLPELRRIVNLALANTIPVQSEDILSVLRTLGMFRHPEDLALIIQAARLPLDLVNPLWEGIIGQYRPHLPLAASLCDALSTPLPTGAIAHALLEMANALADARTLVAHPFDQRDGYIQLWMWVSATEPAAVPLACRATAALPYLAAPARDELLARAQLHPDPSVQVTAAWAQAAIGADPEGATLKGWCLDPRHSALACQFMHKLRRAREIPAAVLAPEFQALAELSRWLAHPHAFGYPPDELTLLETHTLLWPPTGDRRTLRLIWYRYHAAPASIAGVGLVGSVTGALLGEATAHCTPGEVLGLHCCWELERRSDPRAPVPRSAAAGEALLLSANPELAARE